MVERSRNRQKFKKENIEVEPSFSKKHAATTSELKLSKKKRTFEKKGKRREREREKREGERAREQQRVAKGERGERTGGSSG